MGIAAVILLLFSLNLLIGTVSIPPGEVADILLHQSSSKESWTFIVLSSRLPQAVTALLSGAALSVSGLLLQTAFRNPLAGPSIFGISSGASLGVAMVTLLFGGTLSIGTMTSGDIIPAVTITGFSAVFAAAFTGAILVTIIIFLFSAMVRNNVMLLIIGIMIGYISNAVTSLLNFFATEEGVRSYVVWGMGNFGGVPIPYLSCFAVVILLALAASLLMSKPLNALLLGERYAENLGVNIVKTRNILLLITGILTAVVTAFCGPIAFIGLATPHIARLILSTDNHHTLLPATILCGSAIALLCNLICNMPGEGGVLPLNAVTPIIGAPVVIYIICRKKA